LDTKLNAALKKAGDDFMPRDYYLDKSNLNMSEDKKCIDYWSFNEGAGVMQSPKLK